jgi:hypothetical protein
MKSLVLLLAVAACAPAMRSDSSVTYRSLPITNNRADAVTIYVADQRVGSLAAAVSRAIMVRDPLLTRCTQVTVRTPMREEWTTPYCTGHLIVAQDLQASFVVP